MENKLEISILNFRNITNEIIFNLVSNKLNFFVGDNNIGKTNILRSINLLDLTTKQNKVKYLAETDKPRGKKFNEGNDEWIASINYDLPINYLMNKFQKVSMPHEELIKIQDKLITHYSYISKGKVSENGGSGLYLKLFSDEMLEKKFDSEIKKIQNELVNETYPNFYNLIDDVDVDFDSINFTYRDLIESRNDAFFRVIDFLNAFTKNSDEQADILNKLIFLKQPRQTNLSKEDSQRIEKEIKSTKSYVENLINKNIDNIFSVFTNLHCKLQISLSQNNDILCNIYQTPGKTIGAITVDLQGSGIKKIVKLIYLLQICKSQDKQKHIILVDEIENCLSINTQLALLKYLKKYVSENNNVYIVCVTHAPSFFTKLKNEKYDDYLMLNICSSLGDGSIGLETVSADEVISLDTGYELANGEDLQNGVAFLAKVLEMPLELAKKIKE